MLMIKEVFVRVLFLLFGVFVSVLFSSAFMGCGSDTLSFKSKENSTTVDLKGDFVQGSGSLSTDSNKEAVSGTIVDKNEKSKEQREEEFIAHCEVLNDSFFSTPDISNTVIVADPSDLAACRSKLNAAVLKSKAESPSTRTVSLTCSVSTTSNGNC